MLADAALEHYNSGDLDDADICASEAGRYRVELPACLSGNEFLTQSFERGRKESVEDEANEPKYYIVDQDEDEYGNPVPCFCVAEVGDDGPVTKSSEDADLIGSPSRRMGCR